MTQYLKKTSNRNYLKGIFGFIVFLGLTLSYSGKFFAAVAGADGKAIPADNTITDELITWKSLSAHATALNSNINQNTLDICIPDANDRKKPDKIVPFFSRLFNMNAITADLYGKKNLPLVDLDKAKTLEQVEFSAKILLIETAFNLIVTQNNFSFDGNAMKGGAGHTAADQTQTLIADITKEDTLKTQVEKKMAEIIKLFYLDRATDPNKYGLTTIPTQDLKTHVSQKNTGVKSEVNTWLDAARIGDITPEQYNAIKSDILSKISDNDIAKLIAYTIGSTDLFETFGDDIKILPKGALITTKATNYFNEFKGKDDALQANLEKYIASSGFSANNQINTLNGKVKQLTTDLAAEKAKSAAANGSGSSNGSSTSASIEDKGLVKFYKNHPYWSVGIGAITLVATSGLTGLITYSMTKSNKAESIETETEVEKTETTEAAGAA